MGQNYPVNEAAVAVLNRTAANAQRESLKQACSQFFDFRCICNHRRMTGFGWKAAIVVEPLSSDNAAMDPSLTIRVATKDDLEEIASVWHASASSMDGIGVQIPTLNAMRSRIDAELASDWKLFLAERSGRVVGMLALKLSEGVLDQIFVLPDAQRSGVGAALLSHAKEMMPSGFSLRMAEGNLRAANFYERSGLTLCGTGAHPSSGRPVRYYEWKVG
ncbi:MAG: GNAT family N-acetyltransferase [Pontixanthobacter sp.]